MNKQAGTLLHLIYQARLVLMDGYPKRVRVRTRAAEALIGVVPPLSASVVVGFYTLIPWLFLYGAVLALLRHHFEEGDISRLEYEEGGDHVG